MRRLSLILPILIVVLLLAPFPASGQTPGKSRNPAVKKIVEAVSQERIAATVRKLESFETRNPLSDFDSPDRGAGAARRWIHEQFESCSPRLQVRYDTSHVK